jgi:uncharacterized HhH-GPD family protein
VRFFLGSATLDDAIAQLVLEVAGGNRIAPQPEWNPLRLTCGERFRPSVEVRAERGVDRRREVGAAGHQGLDEIVCDDHAVQRRSRWLRPEKTPEPRHAPSVRSRGPVLQIRCVAQYRTRVAQHAAPTLQLQWTGDPDADRLVSEDPTALLIGFCLDQQVPIEWAFQGPLRMRERLGTIDPVEVARMDPSVVEKAFQTPPALHRFPVSMAQRVYGLCQVIANEYGGDTTRIWTEAQDAKELQRRFAALPGFGAAKARIMVGVVAKQLGVRTPGWEDVAPDWPTLADVRTVAEREQYQAQKRAFKAARRAEAAANGDTGNAPATRKRPAKTVARGRA